jgi:hypothetical protein
MDARRFSIEPWMASRKIAMTLNERECFYRGKGPLLLVTFLWALAKKSNSLAQREKAVYFGQNTLDGATFVCRKLLCSRE